MEQIHGRIIFKDWMEKREMNYVTKNDPFKALNINVHTFKAAAASTVMLFILCINECVRDDVALTWTAAETVLYIK